MMKKIKNIKKTPASEVLSELNLEVVKGTDTMIELAWEYVNDNILDWDGTVRISFATAAGWAGLSYPAKTYERRTEIEKIISKELTDEFNNFGYKVTKYNDFFGNVAGIKISAYKNTEKSGKVQDNED